MKKHLLLCLLSGCSLFVTAQTYTTVQSGNYTNPNTWGGAASAPPASGTCNCQITVSTGHTLTIDGDRSLTNANFILLGANSILTLSNNTNLELLGTNSTIDVRTNQSFVRKTNNTNGATITLKGETIFISNNTRFPASAALGNVQGPASASALRTSPQWINSTLPVTLSSFKVSSKENKVSLSWITDLEINSSHFEIERSNDSRAWVKIGTVNAAGNTGVSQNYSFTDNAPLNGNNFYRLKIVDIDAKYEYSPIKNAIITVSGITITAGPNPAYSTLNVMIAQVAAKDFQVKLINRSGQVIYNRKYAGSLDRISIDVSKFSEGNYFVEVSDANGAKTIKNILVLRK